MMPEIEEDCGPVEDSGLLNMTLEQPKEEFAGAGEDSDEDLMFGSPQNKGQDLDRNGPRLILNEEVENETLLYNIPDSNQQRRS
jgi:hypothetical protein